MSSELLCELNSPLISHTAQAGVPKDMRRDLEPFPGGQACIGLRLEALDQVVDLAAAQVLAGPRRKQRSIARAALLEVRVERLSRGRAERHELSPRAPLLDNVEERAAVVLAALERDERGHA